MFEEIAVDPPIIYMYPPTRLIAGPPPPRVCHKRFFYELELVMQPGIWRCVWCVHQKHLTFRGTRITREAAILQFIFSQ